MHVPRVPAVSEDDPVRIDGYLVDLEAFLRELFELGERRDWSRHALASPVDDGQLVEARRAFASSLAGSEVAALLERRSAVHVDASRRSTLSRMAHRISRVAVDLDEQVESSVSAADRLERDAPADDRALAAVLVSAFSRRELLARQRGYEGYVQLCLAGEGLTLHAVAHELDEAEARALGEPAHSEGLDTGLALPDPATVAERLRAFFSPLLRDVEVRVAPTVAVAGMAKLVSWPGDIRIAARPSGSDAGSSERLEALGVLAHELGHALHWRLLAELGVDFLDFITISAAEHETFADLGERLLFEPEVGGELGLTRSRRLWQARRLQRMRLDLGRARFELGAYAAALDDPSSLQTRWRAELQRTGADPGRDSWVLDGHGFYTEDPMRRYAYPLAWLRSDDLLASFARPLTGSAIARRLRRSIDGAGR
jgi:hypothetical protein